MNNFKIYFHLQILQNKILLILQGAIYNFSFFTLGQQY